MAAKMNFCLLLLFLATVSSSFAFSENSDCTLRHAQILCDGTLYPDLCVSTVVAIPNVESMTLSEVISHTISQTADKVGYSTSDCASFLRNEYFSLNHEQRLCITDCLELLQITVEELQDAIISSTDHIHDLQNFLTAAITNQYTCLDGFAMAFNGSVPDWLNVGLTNISQLVSNSLAMTNKVPQKDKTVLQDFSEGSFPSWVPQKNQKLFQTPVDSIKIDLVVSQDGTGDFMTINDAVAAAPNKSDSTFVIYIKTGGYFENVVVDSNKHNLMFVGDGMWKTVVKSDRNNVDGWPTYCSATVSVLGYRFQARDMTFENTAGPSKHQAVAFRITADQSSFYRCGFVGYQDTLYVHTLRQFFRECDIYGTVDFIFGNAVAVFQNCNLYARKPNPGQKNVFTAQGRRGPNQSSGISILNSKIAAAADLIPVKDSVKSYLGRPWQNYSRTVIIGTNIEDLIEPQGWLEWDGDFALDTLYYGEYMNVGGGSNTSNRVTWPGYRVINNSIEASQFAVNEFIQGDQWLNDTTIPYDSPRNSYENLHLNNTRSTNSSSSLHNQKVLRDATCSFGIFIDRGLGGSSQVSDSEISFNVAVVFIGGKDDREALSFGSRIAEHPGIGVSVICFRRDDHYDETNVSIKVDDDEQIIDEMAIAEFNTKIEPINQLRGEED
ncbi:pectin methylesterase, family CE8 [Zostera marina]|uniref:Pectinesterase n=1 Tax=Zostera marina TaxID=29655 RepID=A0A0K9NVQ6_ZOSMR|nr:pectin methylesterase, family CE8 [Zostera marina]